MISALPIVALLAVIAWILWSRRNAAITPDPSHPSLTPAEWFLLVTAPVPLLMMFVVPLILHLSPRGKAGGSLVLVSSGLSAALLAFGGWVARRAKHPGHQRKIGIVIGAALVAGMPLALTFLLIAIEFVTGGWAY